MFDLMNSNELKELSDMISSMPYSYKVSEFSKDIKDNYQKYESKKVSVAGRITGLRKSGKLAFADILDKKGKIQIYFDYGVLGEEKFANAKKLNAGDIIGV